MKKDNEMGGNIPGGNFLSGNFTDENFPGGNLMSENFPIGNFPRGNFPRTINNAQVKKSDCNQKEKKNLKIACFRIIPYIYSPHKYFFCAYQKHA